MLLKTDLVYQVSSKLVLITTLFWILLLMGITLYPFQCNFPRKVSNGLNYNYNTKQGSISFKSAGIAMTKKNVDRFVDDILNG
ncbi:MAG: hypothetical protein O6943_03785, partial [Bacteroidetes bacterium]|nr:hypothetical protein [Bacteroidota bacterium]